MVSPLSAEHKRKISEALKRVKQGAGRGIQKAAIPVGVSAAIGKNAITNPTHTAKLGAAIGLKKASDKISTGKVMGLSTTKGHGLVRNIGNGLSNSMVRGSKALVKSSNKKTTMKDAKQAFSAGATGGRIADRINKFGKRVAK